MERLLIAISACFICSLVFADQKNTSTNDVTKLLPECSWLKSEKNRSKFAINLRLSLQQGPKLFSLTKNYSRYTQQH